MVKEIVTWCDRHMEAGENVKGLTHTLALDGEESTLDLCDPCWAELTTPIRGLVEAMAPARPAKPKGDAGRVVCPTCGKDVATRSTLSGHHQALHGVALAALERKQGHTVDGRPIVAICTECDQGWGDARGASNHVSVTGHAGWERVSDE